MRARDRRLGNKQATDSKSKKKRFSRAVCTTNLVYTWIEYVHLSLHLIVTTYIQQERQTTYSSRWLVYPTHIVLLFLNRNIAHNTVSTQNLTFCARKTSHFVTWQQPIHTVEHLLFVVPISYIPIYV